MIIIGLTGGIGTGKSTVSNYLKEHDCLILDADAISRQMTEKGQPALIDIAKAFGEDLLVDGVLDRQALGNIVFNDKEKLDILQSIITNKVVEYINTRIEELKAEHEAKISDKIEETLSIISQIISYQQITQVGIILFFESTKIKGLFPLKICIS